MIGRSSFAALAVGFLVTGCAGWWGGEFEDPLPGKRESVMLIDESIRVDPAVGQIDIVLPPPAPNSDWPQSGGIPSHAMHHLALGADLTRVWSADIGAGTSSDNRLLSMPVIGRDRVFAIDAESSVTALTLQDGKVLWKTSPEGLEDSDRLRGGGLAFDEGRLFVTTGSGYVVALDAETGDEIWRRDLFAPLRAAPTVIDGVVLVISSSNQLFALSASTGDIRWQHAAFFEQAAILGGAAPAARGRLSISTFSSGEVFAITVNDGQELWSDTVLRPRRTLAIGAISDISGVPVIDRNLVFVAGTGGEMAALDIETGTRRWDISVTSADMPWVAGDFIYLLTGQNEVVCLLRDTGQIRWVNALPRLSDPSDPESTRFYWTGPILAGDRLILAGSTGEALSLSPYTGEVLGRLDVGSSFSLPPIVASETLFFLDDDARLFAYR